jgi:hypothetical protein
MAKAAFMCSCVVNGGDFTGLSLPSRMKGEQDVILVIVKGFKEKSDEKGDGFSNKKMTM